MTFVDGESATQPEVWRSAEALASEAFDRLPGMGQRVIFVGCGTSLVVGQAVAAMREELGCGESDAFPASEVPVGRRYDLAVAVSRSGTTTEVLSACRELGESMPVLAATAEERSPLGWVASIVVAMPFADERSVVQTRFATATVALFRAAFGERLDGVVEDAALALGAPLAIPDVCDVSQFVFLGRSWSVGLAREATLKLREAAGAWSEAYAAMEYRHGPISAAGPGTVVWAFDSLPQGLEAEISSTGARLVAPAGDPMAELVRAQRVAVALALARELDPDRPRGFSRSVVLEGERHGS